MEITTIATIPAVTTTTASGIAVDNDDHDDDGISNSTMPAVSAAMQVVEISTGIVVAVALFAAVLLVGKKRLWSAANNRTRRYYVSRFIIY